MINSLFVTPYFPTISQPNSVPFLPEIIKELKSHNIGVDVLLYRRISFRNVRRPTIEYVDGVKVFIISAVKICPNRLGIKVLNALIVGLQLRLLSFDHSNYEKVYFQWILPTFTIFHRQFRFYKGTLIGVVRGRDLDVERLLMQNEWDRAMVHLDKVYFNGSHGIHFLSEEMQSKSSVVYNLKSYIDCDDRLALNVSRSEAVCFVGRLDKSKRVDLLLTSLKGIDRPIDVHIIGEGEDMERLLEIDVGVNHDVKFHGSLSNNAVIAYLSSCSFLVLPSLREGVPNCIVEALFYGTNVFARRVGGIPDLIIEGETGFLFESDEEFISKFEYILSEGWREDIAKNGKNRITKLYNSEAILKHYR